MTFPIATSAADPDAPALRDRAVRAAAGKLPFDVLLSGGLVADMVTGELREADVGLVGALIASVHPRGSRQDAARVVALDGAVVAPGLIDTHLHIESSMITPRSYAEVVVPQGTTTICWDPHEVGNVGGLEAVRRAVTASRDLPLRILVEAPSCVPSAPGLERSGAVFDVAAMTEMLSWPEVIGVAEVMDMRGVIERSANMSGIVQAGLASGKTVFGHARDLKDAPLQAFCAAGVASDHELTGEADVLSKLRAGLTIELRGSHPGMAIEAVRAFEKIGHVPQTVTLCTDDIFPDDLVTKGGIIELMRVLAGAGMKPVDVLRCATLNAARWLKRNDLGLVAPGRRADLVVFGDLDSFPVRRVFVSGCEVAADGAMTVPVRPDTELAPTQTMRLAPVTEEVFRIPAPGVSDGGTVRIHTVNTPRFTRWAEREAEVRDGAVVVPDDCILMVVFNRYGASAKPGIGVLEGWGEWRGAFATTILHDSHNLAVFGRDPADLAAAANALIACGGGMAAVMGGRPVSVLDLPVYGLLSEDPPEMVAERFAALRAASLEVASGLSYPLVKLVIGASLACNPGPHVTDLGITDGMSGKIVTDSVIAGGEAEGVGV
ncbi:adenine deaminase [Acetobacter oeni]|uniref:Adenine deaminase n=1 Tax=Acetobacter oeni TaxID=304077 RepID=A0A511XH38_9PROT|nr:adenine deaminase C-terminal domain-containing protein [Acetobacter oeni]MBB3882389.1 adenine deaminase [Acetobacter oeni]NHO18510.1 amidohydrolase family protein [Acetobacter oeni]GBR09372.1 adenine deaminase [Acetobacter oeni LMG 21952]GEN62248.1 adenine deaminase [Acetobacter oeni]